jgi:hypothetical protein
MKAITLQQPCASLVMTGVKTIETRSRSTDYRGRLAIHAGLLEPSVGAQIGDYQVHHANCPKDAPWQLWASAHHLRHEILTPLVFGAVIATCELVDVVPISHIDHDAGRTEDRVVDMPLFRGLHLLREDRDTIIESQRSYGDFTPGRFAWILDDIKPTTQRCPLCWGEGSWPHFTRQVCPLCCVKKVTAPVPARGRQGLWNWGWEENND